ncbi:MAG: DUF433 domain-containing protein [Cyanobacteria bacterium P01_D01_bin.44]
MTYSATEYKHIQLDDEQVPIIEGTTMKVVELTTSHLAYGWSPEELHFQYPHITLGKIYSALAYYWDHRKTLDADIQQRLRKVEKLYQSSSPSRMAQKLKERGVIE